MLVPDQFLAKGARRIFVAADLPKTYTRLEERYGQWIVFAPRADFDRSARQI